MNFELAPHQIQIDELCTIFARNEIAPRIKELEENVDMRLELFRRMANMGLFLLSVPKQHGGNFIDTISYVIALKAFAKVDAGISVAIAVTNMVSETISRFGTEEQHKKYIPKIGSGECVPLSFALTEKNAGSDAKAIQAEAHYDPENQHVFIINGEKQFITNGDIAGAIIMMAKTKNRSGEEEISAFLIDKETPGLSVVKKENKLGLLTANLVSLRFDNCRVPAEQLLGQQGQGLQIALSSLDSGRIGIAAQAVGIAEAAFEAALRFAKERYQFGHAIGDNQGIAFKLADMKVKLSAARLMLYKAAWLKDKGEIFSEEASEAKLYCTEASNEIVDEALQIHGGYGYIKDYPVEKYFRDARVTTLYEGTSEIQRIIISRHIFNEGFHLSAI